MKRKQNIAVLLGVAWIAVGGTAVSAEKIDIGQREYRDSCLNCHGESGDGNGPYAQLLNKRTSDLTQLTKRNNGVFPFARVYEVIDGRQVVSGHGERDMPIWGNVYRIKAGEYYAEMNYNPEYYVRSRILAVIEYISRLQKN
jgi:mono/diheme cytochrome c family protein